MADTLKHTAPKHAIPRVSSTPFWFTIEQLDRLERCAKILGCSRSEFLRGAVHYAALRTVSRG